MKLTYSLALFAAIAVAMSQTVQAQSEQLFTAKEMSLDLFGTGSVGQTVIDHPSGNRAKKDGRLGAGAGLNYFFSKYVGIGGDAYSESTAHSFVDNASGNLIVRIPIESLHLAPYAYGGAGYQFDTAERPFGQFGAGIDVRFTKHIGIFVDARYVMIKDNSNFGVGRAGVRLAF